MFTLTYETPGRGAFPVFGLGGTLDVDGDAPGPYYRAPAASISVAMPGLVGALAVRNESPCSVNYYAVYRAVMALQRSFGATPDGILGPNTSAAIKTYQKAKALIVDGVIGPQTCRSLYQPLALREIEIGGHAQVLRTAVLGTIAFESNWDIGAVGVTTPQDLGLGQINGLAHPDMSVDARFSPIVAIPWIVAFIDANFAAMNYDIDAGILAYNLGIGGARSWIKAGRPQAFNGTDTWGYIARIKILGRAA